jgi:hypothetical protein
MGDSNGAVTPGANGDGELTIDAVGISQVRRKLVQLQTRADKSDQKVREINVDAKVVARRAKEAKAGLATLSRR